jgi:hypothetical protein
MLKRAFLAFTFIAALSAGGLGLSSAAMAWHDCDDDYGYRAAYYPSYVGYSYGPRVSYYQNYPVYYRSYPAYYRDHRFDDDHHHHHGHHHSGMSISFGF